MAKKLTRTLTVSLHDDRRGKLAMAYQLVFDDHPNTDVECTWQDENGIQRKATASYREHMEER